MYEASEGHLSAAARLNARRVSPLFLVGPKKRPQAGAWGRVPRLIVVPLLRPLRGRLLRRGQGETASLIRGRVGACAFLAGMVPAVPPRDQPRAHLRRADRGSFNVPPCGKPLTATEPATHLPSLGAEILPLPANAGIPLAHYAEPLSDQPS